MADTQRGCRAPDCQSQSAETETEVWLRGRRCRRSVSLKVRRHSPGHPNWFDLETVHLDEKQFKIQYSHGHRNACCITRIAFSTSMRLGISSQSGGRGVGCSGSFKWRRRFPMYTESSLTQSKIWEAINRVEGVMDNCLYGRKHEARAENYIK